MIRKAYIIVVVVAGLALVAAHCVPGYDRIVTSAQRFQQSYRGLKSSGNSLNTMERLVFSFVLASQSETKPTRPTPDRS